MSKRPSYECETLLNGTMVEKFRPAPRHRLTGINAYLPKHRVVDEWQRVQELRAAGHAEGGNKLSPTQ